MELTEGDGSGGQEVTTDVVDAVVDPDLVVDRAAWRAARDLAPSTVIEYCRLVPDFKGWCRPPSHGGSPARWLTPLPAETDTLTAYIVDMCQQGKAPATIRKARAAILWWHRLHGQPVPDGRPSSVVLSEYETTRRAAGKGPKRAVPLPFDTVVACLAGTDRTTVQGKRDAAVLLLAYAAMLPAGRLVKLRIRDVTDCRAGLLVRGPVVIVLPHWMTGGEHHPAVCVVEAVVEWVRVLVGRGADPAGPLLRPVDQHGNIGGLDRRAGGAHDGWMADGGLGHAFAGLLIRGGVPDPGRYSLQSLRAGGIIKRRRDGALVGQLAAEAGLSTVSPTLLAYLIAAEATAPASLAAPDADLSEMDR